MRTITLEYTYTVLAQRTVTVPDDFDVNEHQRALVYDGGDSDFGLNEDSGFFDDDQFHRDIPHGYRVITWEQVQS